MGSAEQMMQSEIDQVRLFDSKANIEIKGHMLMNADNALFCVGCQKSWSAWHHGGSIKETRAHIRENGGACRDPWILESRIDQIKARYLTPDSAVVDAKPELTLSELKEDLDKLHAKIDRLLLYFGVRHGR